MTDSRRVKRPHDWRLLVVRAIDEAQRRDLEVFADALLEAQGLPPKLVDAMLYDAGDEDLIEWGVSARTGWLTPKGQALLDENR